MTIKQDEMYDAQKPTRFVSMGDRVHVRNYATGAKWLPGIITKINGPLSYEVKTEYKDIKCHIDHLQKHQIEVASQYQTSIIFEGLRLIFGWRSVISREHHLTRSSREYINV